LAYWSGVLGKLRHKLLEVAGWQGEKSRLQGHGCADCACRRHHRGGDLYASGFLYGLTRYGLTRALPLPICGGIGRLCAAEIISHFGARPEVDLSQLLAESGRT
jgi:hypothetical protein